MDCTVMLVPACRYEADGELCYGQYDYRTDMITLYEGSILAGAKDTRSDYRDMLEMVVLHEQRHRWQYQNGVLYKKNNVPKDGVEEDANRWAWFRFTEKHGRQPNVHYWF